MSELGGCSQTRVELTKGSELFGVKPKQLERLNSKTARTRWGWGVWGTHAVLNLWLHKWQDVNKAKQQKGREEREESTPRHWASLSVVTSQRADGAVSSAVGLKDTEFTLKCIKVSRYRKVQWRFFFQTIYFAINVSHSIALTYFSQMKNEICSKSLFNTNSTI